MRLDLSAPWQIHKGHVLKLLARLPDNFVHMILTSPPYWGLRDYGIPALIWGGDPECKHKWGDRARGRAVTSRRQSREEQDVELVPFRAKRSVWTIATQAMDLEMCGTCLAIYNGDSFACLRQRTVDGRPERQCKCGEWHCWLSHFATFPEALAETPILAATSAFGVCIDCGTPWRRTVEPSESYKNVLGRSWLDHDRDLERGMKQVRGENRQNRGRDFGHATADYRTTGWEPSCKCKAQRVPALVLDPFSGAATTGVVAVRLGRRFLGFDLKKEYCALGRYRIENDRPLFNTNTAALAPVQENLFA